MKIFKRAWISIIRRKVNSIILLLIVFLLANILLTTLSVTTSLKETQKSVLEQFPPVVSIDLNYEKSRDELAELEMNADMADKLYDETKDIVKSYDYSSVVRFYKNSNTKSAVISTSDEVNEVMKNSDDDILIIYGTQLDQPGMVYENEGKLIKGSGFSKSDLQEGKPKIIVTKQFAEANELEVGSFIELERRLYKAEDYITMLTGEAQPYFLEVVDFEVVGILEINRIEKYLAKQTTNPDENFPEAGEVFQLTKSIYSTNSYLNPIVEDNISRSHEAEPDLGRDDIGFHQGTNVYPKYVLKDVNDLDEFIKAGRKIYNSDGYEFYSAAQEYEVIAKPVKATEDLMDLIFKITVIASIVILSLVLCIFMYLRQKEMGIFLALGEQRKNIILQLLIETLIIALIGTSLAVFSSIIFSNIVAENTINSLLIPSNINESVVISANYEYGLTPEMISNQYQGGFSIITILFFYLVMILTTIISQIATALYLLRLNPKKILM